MKSLEFMSWVDFLPEVGTPILAERDKLAAQVAAAEELERQAADLRAAVQQERAPLIDKIISMWSLLDIETAANAASPNDAVSPSDVSASTTRPAVGAFVSEFSPLAILRASPRGPVH